MDEATPSQPLASSQEKGGPSLTGTRRLSITRLSIKGDFSAMRTAKLLVLALVVALFVAASPLPASAQSDCAPDPLTSVCLLPGDSKFLAKLRAECDLLADRSGYEHGVFRPLPATDTVACKGRAYGCFGVPASLNEDGSCPDGKICEIPK
jgi:hypothetical protein